MSQARVLVSLPTKHHVEIALDEITGLQKLGFDCDSFHYAAKNGYDSTLGRVAVIFHNAFNLIKKSRQFKPDIIYFNSRLEVVAGIRDMITIFLVRFFYGKKALFVIKSHGSDLEIFSDNRFLIKRVILPYLKENVAAWLFLSSEEQQKVNAIGYLKKNCIFLTKNIVRIDHFQHDPFFRTRHNIPEDHKILLFVGRIIAEKGIFEVVDAFAKINQSHKVTLIIVGDGNALNAVKKKIESEFFESKRVILTGFISEQEVIVFYSNADILVFPTYFPEGFPMALFNSIGAGMGIITTKIRAAKDYLSEPANCLWVKEQNAADVSSKIDKLLRSDVTLNLMRANNLTKASEFSMQNVASELATIFDSIIKKDCHD